MESKNSPERLPDALRYFDTMPDSASVRLPVVCKLFGISDATVWRWTKINKLPQPERRGRVTSWNVGKLRRVLDAADKNATPAT
jgi:predicted DNA-binding transcriptional regulator AlpA